MEIEAQLFLFIQCQRVPRDMGYDCVPPVCFRVAVLEILSIAGLAVGGILIVSLAPWAAYLTGVHVCDGCVGEFQKANSRSSHCSDRLFLAPSLKRSILVICVCLCFFQRCVASST
jgi:hypothetical protein